ncbi:MAG: SDR family oxidoreductase [Gammaproteobacteria bacterium]|nr:SDR family oxidoreductase [Gammaproteobacteria bacterium]
MKILVSGANGFIGRALCTELLRQKHEVRCVVRDKIHSEDLLGEIVEVGEINSKTEWKTVFKDIETVIHLAARVHVMSESSDDPLAAFRAINVDGTENMAYAAAKQGVKRFIYISSIKVNGERTTSTCFTENDFPGPEDPYGVSKYESEQVLQCVSRDTGLEVVTIRPPLVYGAGVGGNFLRLLRMADWNIPLPLALVNNRRSMIYLGNLVDVLIVCATRPEAAGKTYLVSDGKDISTSQLIRNIKQLMQKPCWLWPFPPSLLILASKLVGKSAELERLIGSLVIDSSKIKKELAWSPPFTVEQGLAEMVHWFQNQYR